MRYYLVTSDASLRGAVGRMVSLEASANDADVILASEWIAPSDERKTYLYFGPVAMQAIVPKFGTVLYPESIAGHSNAFYLGITEFPDLVRRFIRDRRNKTSAGMQEPIIVIVDDNEENRQEAKRQIPDAMVFAEPDVAIDFIQTGTRIIQAVLTDMVMPLGDEQFLNDGFREHNNQPLGILLCFAARVRRIPVAVVTSGHEETPLEVYFHAFAKRENISVVNGRHKDWLKGLKLAT